MLITLVTTSAAFSKLNKNNIECSREAYNCPSYKGQYQEKRLLSCEEVKLVWNKCGSSDPHGLDGDNDNKPCEKKCRDYNFKQE